MLILGNAVDGYRVFEPAFKPRECGPTPEELDEWVGRVERHVLKLKEQRTMHYRNGREAKNGDRIVKLCDEGQVEAFGVLHGATPGNDFCNGNIAPIMPFNTGACLCDCLHIDDLAAILKEKGLDKRPASK